MIADCEICNCKQVPCSSCRESQRLVCFICQGDIADPYGEMPPDYEAAALALRFRKLANGKWYIPVEGVDTNTASTFDTAEQIFDWWGRASGNAKSVT